MYVLDDGLFHKGCPLTGERDSGSPYLTAEFVAEWGLFRIYSRIRRIWGAASGVYLAPRILESILYISVKYLVVPVQQNNLRKPTLSLQWYGQDRNIRHYAFLTEQPEAYKLLYFFTPGDLIRIVWLSRTGG